VQVLEEGHPLFLELPGWLYDTPVDTMLEQLHRSIAALHIAASGHNGADPSRDANFVVLHLVTALWGLDRIVVLLEDEASKRDALQTFWGAAAAILSTMEAALSSARLSSLWEELCSCGGHAGEGAGQEKRWRVVTERAFHDEEEHNLKLVYVQHELNRRYGEWEGFLRAAETFTDPPAIGPSSSFSP
jgi:hypothetical protein